MTFQLKLSHQGLILVAVPLLFEIGFIAWLAEMQAETEREVERQTHAHAIVNHTNKLLRLMMDSAAGVGAYSVSESPDYLERSNRLREAAKDELLVLGELVKNGTENQRIALNEVKEIILNAEKQVREIHHMIKHDHAFEGRMRAIKLRPMANRLSVAVDRLAEAERVIEESSPKVQAEQRAQMKQLIIAGVTGNILLALTLAFYFNRKTTKRLATLMDNTQKLAKEQALNPPLDGSDELAHLDKVFRDMANSLGTAMRKERVIVEKAVDVICTLDQFGNITRISPACLKMWGYAPPEILSKPWLDLIALDDKDVSLSTFRGINQGASGEATFENRVQHKDGRMVYMSWSIRWSLEDHLFFCVGHDITERREIERMKEEFISMVSHDLRTPLTSVRGFFELLESGICGDLNEKGKNKLAAADRNIVRLINLIRDLLDVERSKSGMMEVEPVEVSASSLIERSIEAIRIQADKLNIAIESEDSDAVVLADSERIVQVIVNLLSNALKFSPSGSKIQISTRSVEDRLEFRVKDEGRGIPAEFRGKIFDRFQQVSKTDATEKEGTGLGLAICKEIVQLHGGTIGVESEEGNGSQFWFQLPLAASNSST